MDFKDDSNIDDEFLQDFIIETREHLETIEMKVLGLETEAGDDQIIHSLFRAFHTIKGLAGFVDQGLIEEISHKTETILDLCRKGSLEINKDISNLILNSSDLIGEICNDINLVTNKGFRQRVSEFMKNLEFVEIYEQRVEKTNNNNSLTSNLKNEELKGIKVEDEDVVSSIHKKNDSKAPDINGGIIRIPTKKVDNLVDMMGELIITQSQIEQEAEKKYDSNDSFLTKLLNMSRIMKEMQSLSMSLRMVALKSTFQKLARIARDTIDELGKDVNFEFEGEETEIDRNIAEKILEPLVHLVKNSLSHGIETPELRRKRGKSPGGKVIVSAYSNKGSVYIEISDDGNGIDLDKVYNKALEKGLIRDSKKYSEKEIQEFIFLPGFSTQKDADTISGRGVGMDVVKTEVAKIGGKIEIINTPEEGCKFILKIPINLAVMNGTIISIMDNKYIIPTLNIKQIIQVKDDSWVEVKGKKSMIRLRDSVIPIIRVAKILNKKAENKAKLVIVLEMDQQFKAILVDDIIGRREIVVKPINEEFSNLDYISGASILGDGTVSLILDIEYLFRLKGA